MNWDEFDRLIKSRRAKNDIKTPSDKVKTKTNDVKPSNNNTHISPKDITKQLKLEEVKGFNDKAFSLQNIINTNFPRNTPLFVVGTKGSGKTYLLASLGQYAYKTKQFKRIFYIYAENVDSTINRAIPRANLYQIPQAVATMFIIKYLNKKTKFCSCARFINSINETKNELPESIEQLSTLPIYWDNYLNDLVKRKHLETSDNLITYANRVIAKYSDKETVLTVEGMSYNIGVFDKKADDDFDCFIIDDIAQFSELFGTTRKNAILYKYFTITRQNMTTFYLAGQELQQLPKMYRSQLGAIVVLKGVDVIDSLRESKLPKLNIVELYKKFITLKPHEGVLINYNSGEIEFIKVDE